jgi:hypothetical protein
MSCSRSIVRFCRRAMFSTMLMTELSSSLASRVLLTFGGFIETEEETPDRIKLIKAGSRMTTWV